VRLRDERGGVQERKAMLLDRRRDETNRVSGGLEAVRYGGSGSNVEESKEVNR
jgi:hypothetical protein